ncbi:MAG: glycosyltransferase family 2 protein [Dehalococcoidia bacterium]
MTTLVVTVPAYNEEECIGDVIREVPRDIPGVDRVLLLVIDDGSTDRTVAVARNAGADFVLSRKRNRGLAVSFREGLDAALTLGADVIVNTDGDNHYDQTRIPELAAPVLSGEADIVIGSRALGGLTRMGLFRTWGNRIANFVFRFLYGLPPDTDVSSGFRAYSREAAMRLVITSKYTYAHESLMSAIDHRLAIVSRVFPARDVTRPSRLMSSVRSHVLRAGTVAFVSFAVHRLFRILTLISALLILAGIIAYIRFLYFFVTADGAGHLQSLVVGSLLIVLGVQLLIGSFFAAALIKNRQLIEEVVYQQRRALYEETTAASLAALPDERTAALAGVGQGRER